MNNFNPLNLLQMLKGKSPKDMVINMINNQMGDNNPLINNLINMAKNGDQKGVETFARNLCKERGIDFDTKFNQFMAQFSNKN